MKPKSSLPRLQEPANCPHPGPDQSGRRLNQGRLDWLGTWNIECSREVHTGLLWGKWKDTDPMADLGVDSGIILKWILNTPDAKT
jgi:hypothetical protein